MGKSNTAVKIMRVDSEKFEQLKLQVEINKHKKTFKVKREEEVNKIYFVYFDEQENLHFIGKRSHSGVIDRTALMREIPEGQNSSQINTHLVALIDREIAQKQEFKLTSREKLLVFASAIVLGLVMGVGSYFIIPLVLIHAIVIGLLSLQGGALAAFTTIRLVNSLFESPNSPNIFKALGNMTASSLLGAGIGCLLGTLVAPGIGALIGAGIGAAVGFSISAVLVVITYVQKKADNPVVIQQLTESLSINEPLGEALKTAERKFSSNEARHYYGDYVGQYKKLFPAVKEMKRMEKEKRKTTI